MHAGPASFVIDSVQFVLGFLASDGIVTAQKSVYQGIARTWQVGAVSRFGKSRFFGIQVGFELSEHHESIINDSRA